MYNNPSGPDGANLPGMCLHKHHVVKKKKLGGDENLGEMGRTVRMV